MIPPSAKVQSYPHWFWPRFLSALLLSCLLVRGAEAATPGNKSSPRFHANDLTRFNLVGFGTGTTGGGTIAETDVAYRKVHTPLEFATAVRDANKHAGAVKVIEIMNDLNLGWSEIEPA
jgi:hypothetical protein